MESIQFERAEFSAPRAMACGSCQAALLGNYYQINSTSVCEGCASSVHETLAGRGSRLGRFGKAFLLGLGAALLGSIGYCLVTHLTGINFALASIGVGIFVGRAVRKGSGGRGGWRYQILAALLTYLAIAGTFIPEVATELRNHSEADKQPSAEVAGTSAPASNLDATTAATESAPANQEAATGVPHALAEVPAPLQFLAALTVLGGIIAAAPILVGMDQPLSLLIYGFGVWRAWASNRRLAIAVSGPHPIAQPAHHAEPAI